MSEDVQHPECLCQPGCNGLDGDVPCVYECAYCMHGPSERAGIADTETPPHE